MVRVEGAAVEVSTPKSSSWGENAIALGCVVEARVAVWVVALSAWAVRVPGLVEVLVRAMVHSAAGARVVGQLWVRVKLAAVSRRLVAARVPRLRRVMFGLASVESARLGAEVCGLSLAR